MGLEIKNFKKGTQIAYIPSHAFEGVHIDYFYLEYGFVMKMHPNGLSAYCRYWRKNHPGELRTVANSELTPLDDLYEWPSVNQEVVDKAIAAIEKEMENE